MGSENFRKAAVWRSFCNLEH
jgi:hypothetical protein